MLYKEGDVWTERGKAWTVKNGVKRTVSKFSQIRKDLQTPLCCPKCNKHLNRIDEKFYKFNSVCQDCTIDYEHELLKQNKYKEYEQARISANAKGFALDLVTFFDELLADKTNKKYVTEDGDVEAWIGDPASHLQKVIEPELEKIKDNILNK